MYTAAYSYIHTCTQLLYLSIQVWMFQIKVTQDIVTCQAMCIDESSPNQWLLSSYPKVSTNAGLATLQPQKHNSSFCPFWTYKHNVDKILNACMHQCLI